mmetsp:Transcript_4042/g.9649  ORF Transcript_4042/g.9649 Transcript_4042/m.9649 type:complete len:253 (+) Transcript_4042:3575-4333(+)
MRVKAMLYEATLLRASWRALRSEPRGAAARAGRGKPSLGGPLSGRRVRSGRMNRRAGVSGKALSWGIGKVQEARLAARTATQGTAGPAAAVEDVQQIKTPPGERVETVCSVSSRRGSRGPYKDDEWTQRRAHAMGSGARSGAALQRARLGTHSAMPTGEGKARDGRSHPVTGGSSRDSRARRGEMQVVETAGEVLWSGRGMNPRSWGVQKGGTPSAAARRAVGPMGQRDRLRTGVLTAPPGTACQGSLHLGP